MHGFSNPGTNVGWIGSVGSIADTSVHAWSPAGHPAMGMATAVAHADARACLAWVDDARRGRGWPAGP